MPTTRATRSRSALADATAGANVEPAPKASEKDQAVEEHQRRKLLQDLVAISKVMRFRLMELTLEDLRDAQ